MASKSKTQEINTNQRNFDIKTLIVFSKVFVPWVSFEFDWDFLLIRSLCETSFVFNLHKYKKCENIQQKNSLKHLRFVLFAKIHDEAKTFPDILHFHLNR